MTTTTSPAGATIPRPPSEVTRRLRHGLWLIPLFGAVTLWATFSHQPSPTTELTSWARFVTTDAFLAQHLVGSIGGLAAYTLGVAALTGILLAGGRRIGAALSGFALSVVGAAGLLAGFGTAAFAQPAIGRVALADAAAGDALYLDVYGSAAFVVLIGGAVLFAAGSILLGRAVAALDGVPRWAAVALGSSGPLIGVLGIAVGPLQTVGALAAIAGGTAIARAARRTPH